MKFEQPPIEKEGLPESTTIRKGAEAPYTGEKRLSPEEASLEANMMRIKLKEVLDREPTSEDYDNALKMVEEMKVAALIEKRTDGEAAFLKLVQIGDKYFNKGVEKLVRLFSLGFVKSDPKFIQEREEFWDDAETKLNRLKQQAEQSGSESE